MSLLAHSTRPRNGISAWRNALAASLLLTASLASAATEYPAGDLTVEDHMPFGHSKKVITFLDTVDYSNVSNFLGQGFLNGGSELQGANTITRLVMDDITTAGLTPGEDVTQIKFSVANFSGTPITVRPRVRFWNDLGGVPGTYYSLPSAVGFSFNPLTFSSGVTVVTGTLGVGLFKMPVDPFWAGITFDNNNGTTGAGIPEMDSMGQGIFDPPDVGSSADLFYATTAAGSFFTIDAPAGSLGNFGGAPVANFGWEFTGVTPTPTTKSSWGRIKNLYR